MLESYQKYISNNTAVLPYGLTEIEAMAFKDCKELTRVEIPNSITRIDYGVSEISDMAKS